MLDDRKDGVNAAIDDGKAASEVFMLGFAICLFLSMTATIKYLFSNFSSRCLQHYLFEVHVFMNLNGIGGKSAGEWRLWDVVVAVFNSRVAAPCDEHTPQSLP